MQDDINVYYEELGLPYRESAQTNRLADASIRPIAWLLDAVVYLITRFMEAVVYLLPRALLVYFIFQVVIGMWDVMMGVAYFALLFACIIPFALILSGGMWKAFLAPVSKVPKDSG